MLAVLIPILNSVMGGIIKPFVAAWTDYERTKLTTGEAGFEAAAKADQAVMQAAITADVQIAALKVQLYGTPTYRIITLIAGVPPAIHFGLVYIDTILASKAFLGGAYFSTSVGPGTPTFNYVPFDIRLGCRAWDIRLPCLMESCT